MSSTTVSVPAQSAAGSPAFKRSSRALFLGGFASFAMLYSVQPLMPMLSAQFALSPAQGSWALSISTMTLAMSLLFTSAISDRIGRKPLMCAAMAVAALMTVLSACAHTYPQLLLARAALGLALGGMPAVAMAYLAEEIEAPSLGLAIGLYISGSAFGGMAGRLLAAVLSDLASWRWALALLGALGLLMAWDFARRLPASRNFHPNRAGWRQALEGGLRHLSDPGLARLFAIAFLLMGCYVGVYNYVGYRLLAAPFNLSQSAVGAISLLYLIGIVSSVWAGVLADRLGRRGVLWIFLATMPLGLLLTLSTSLPLIVVGLALFTFGFFAAHSVASSWVGRRARAPQALASAWYLFFYYLGASLVGSASGLVWARAGWGGVVALMCVALGLALLTALSLRNLAPLGPRPAAVPV